VIEAFAFDTSYQPFTMPIGLWRVKRGMNHFRPHLHGSFFKGSPKHGIIIANQKSRAITPGTDFAHLLSHPGVGWISGEIEILNLAGGQVHHHQEIDGTKKEIMHHGKVANKDGLGMGLQESCPCLS